MNTLLFIYENNVKVLFVLQIAVAWTFRQVKKAQKWLSTSFENTVAKKICIDVFI